MYVAGPPKTSTHQAVTCARCVLADTAREERRQQVVALDPVVEGVDQPPERRLAARPLEQRRHRLVGHAVTLASAGPAP